MAAMFFQNNHIKCPKCGGDVMSLQTLCHYEKGKKDKEIIYEPCGRRIVCANCGNKVMDVDNFTTLKSKS